jgi:SAM-dependent methyltransferase
MTEKPDSVSEAEGFEFEALNPAQNYRAALVREFSPFLSGNVVEVGAGIGQMTSLLAALPSVKRLVAVEFEPRFSATFRRLHPRLDLIEGVVTDVPSGLPWDAIVSVNVLEHILEDDLELAYYRRLLAARGGHLCLFVPAREEIYARIDRDFGHYRRYARPWLRRKLEEAGFSIVALHYFNCIGYFAWWFHFCLLKRRRFDVRSVALFDRMIFPLVHALESRLLRPPFGQSLLAIAQAAQPGEIPEGRPAVKGVH